MFGSGNKGNPGYDYTNVSSPASPTSYHKGGKVKKGGTASVLKGEEVLTEKESKKYHEIKKKVGGKPTIKKNAKSKKEHKKYVAAKRA